MDCREGCATWRFGFGMPSPWGFAIGKRTPATRSQAGVPDWILESDNPLEAAERATLTEVIERCRWNFTAAAEMLKVSRTTLHAKARRFGIKRH
jgi:transcriptional regulator of acetoin/glycerol metabolism